MKSYSVYPSLHSYLSLVAIAPIFSISAYAQCPVSDFSASNTACIEESIRINNNSTEVANYEWDFCDEEFSYSTPTYGAILTDGLLATSTDIALVERDDGWWYGFVAKEGGLMKLSFGEELHSVPQIAEINDPGNLLGRPIALKIFQFNDRWFGLVVSSISNNVLLLDFESGIDAQPSITAIPSALVEAPSDIDIIIDSGNVYAFIVNGSNGQGSVVKLDFRDNLANDPIENAFTIPGSDKLRGISFLSEECNSYEAFVSSFDNKRLFRMTFPGGIDQNPVVNVISNLSRSLNNLASLKYIKQQSRKFIFVHGRQGNLYKYELDNEGNTVSINDFGSVDNSAFGFSMFKDKTSWFGFSFEYTTGRLSRISFPENCSANIPYTTEASPSNINFTSAGEYSISLKATSEEGNVSSTFEIIQINEDVSPTVDIASQPNLCTGSTSEFLITTTQPLTSATWTINGETRTGETVTYDFLAPGTYPVTLEVESANGCGNRLTQEITIYEPPAPNFTAPAGQICTNGTVPFINTTDAKGADADSVIAYQWFVDDELVSEVANPDLTFATGGTKTVRLEASIPGCTEVIEQTINVLQGPTVNFSVAQICQGDPVVFENLTTGEGITGYAWDFGDGGSYASEALESPTYTFTDAGTFTVALSVSNTLGCQNVYQQEVTVFEQPRVGFLSDIACGGTPTQFTDTTTAGLNANVIAWQWDFGDGLGTANVRNPTYAYPQPGTYQVKLVAQTTAGCIDSTSQTITVESPIEARFTSTSQCTAQDASYTVRLTDASIVTDGDVIDRWFWTINNENFVSPEVIYAFPEPGEYEVSLTTFAASGCNTTITQTVRVDSLPQPAFTVPEGCTGEPLAFRDETNSRGQTIASYAWSFMDASQQTIGNAFGTEVDFTFDEPGTYEATLTAITADSCSFTTSQPVVVTAAPVATFTASPAVGGGPLKVVFENTTTGASNYQWDFGGEGTSTEENPTATFTEVGSYRVTLTATNAAGCTSTAQQTVEVVVPVQDLRISDLAVVESPTSEAQQILVSISNQGSITASGVVLTVNLDEAVTVQETLTTPVAPGQTLVYPLKFQLPNRPGNALRYLCVSLDGNVARFENGRECVSLNEQLNVEPPFPNPASDKLYTSVILPKAGVVALQLMNQRGQVLRRYQRAAALVGLNSFVLNVKGLPAGAYLLQVTYQGKRRQFRVAVGH